MTTLRDKLDVLPLPLVETLTRFLDIHGLADNPRSAYFALGLKGLGLLDREFTDIHGGSGSFDQLRNWQDCDVDDETVNYRVFLQYLAAGGTPFVPPFSLDSPGAQVLTADRTAPSYAEGPFAGPDVLLWSPEAGVHWGPALTPATSVLPTTLVFGDQHLVVAETDTGWVGVPSSYIWFPSLQSLASWCADRQFFGNVSVYLKQASVNGTLSIEASSVGAPFYVRLVPPPSGIVDQLLVSRTRLYLDGGTTGTPVPYHSPRLEFDDCVFDPRSLLTVEQTSAEGSSIVFRRCKGQLQVYGDPSVLVGAEELVVEDSDLTVNIGTTSSGNRARRLTVANSHLVFSAITTGVEQRSPLIVNATDSEIAVNSGPPPAALYWTDTSRRQALFNYPQTAYAINAQGCRLSLSHLRAVKSYWPANFDPTFMPPLATPLVTLSASRAAVLDIGDSGDQDGVEHRYKPPLIASQSALIAVNHGSFLSVGLDRVSEPQTPLAPSFGLFLDRPGIFAEFGAVGLRPVIGDGTGNGVLVDRRLIPMPFREYNADELSVVEVPPEIQFISILI